MGSIVDGTMAMMGMIGGLMLAYMSLRASEPVGQVVKTHKHNPPFPANSQRKAA